MLKNYFKIAWRNIIKHPFYATVNMVGLFAGITFSFLIGAYVWGELQVNQQLKNANRQYFLKSVWKNPNIGNDITTFGPLAKRLKEDYPSIVSNFYRWDGISSVVSKGDKHLRESIQLGDSTLLSMYGFELLHGNANTALVQPFSVVITKDIAIKYFGKTDVVNQTLNIQSFTGANRDFTITGVLKEVADNSVTHLNAANLNAFFIPTNTYAFFGRMDFDTWNNIYIPSYIELQPGTSIASLNNAIKKLIHNNTAANFRENIQIEVVPITDYYLQQGNGVIKRMLYVLSFVGLFILLMVVVNFINIAISSSGYRMKEIGLRKVLGGLQKHVIFQFLTESFILVLFATVLALAVYPLAAPAFSSIVGKTIPTLSSFPLYFMFIPLAFVLIVGLLVGVYPAFVLSSINTVSSLKGKLHTVKENIVLRKSLVGFQFVIALVVLISAAIVTQQVSHFFSQSLGYNKELIVASQVPRDWSPTGVRKMETIRDEFARMPEVSSVSLSFEIPNGNNGGSPPVYKLGTDSTKAIPLQALITDENYLNTYQIKLKHGEFFDNRKLDSGKVVLNEKAVAALGYKDALTAIGQQIRILGDQTVFTIKGITNDFHFGSMQQGVQPIIFFNVTTSVVHRYLSFKLKPDNINTSIEAIQKKWTSLMPGSSFEYTFMDDTLKKLYATELQLKKASYIATCLSLMIVLLGILGLVTLSLQKRTKEIGIRKVLGASVSNIVLLFIKDFAMLILVAALLACPLSYWLMNNWLQNYASHVTISAFPFTFAVGCLGLFTFLLIVMRTAKSANTNPIKSLRTE
jgi:putative ABC transport system permease protein